MILSIFVCGLCRRLIWVTEVLRVVECREFSSEPSIAFLASFKWSVHVIGKPFVTAPYDFPEQDCEIACEDNV